MSVEDEESGACLIEWFTPERESSPPMRCSKNRCCWVGKGTAYREGRRASIYRSRLCLPPSASKDFGICSPFCSRGFFCTCLSFAHFQVWLCVADFALCHHLSSRYVLGAFEETTKRRVVLPPSCQPGHSVKTAFECFGPRLSQVWRAHAVA